MKKNFSLFFLLIICACNFSFAQQVTFEKYFDYGFAEAGNCVQQTTDGGYIIFGRQGIAIGVSKILLLKMDSLGTEQWHKLIGKNNADNYSYSGQQTSDGGYIMTGNTTGIVPSDYDVYLVKTDSNGDTLWTKQYGTSGPNMYDNGWCVRQTNDGGYIICGQTGLYGWLLKTDLNGDTLWTKKIILPSSNQTWFYSVQQTMDTGFVLTGAIKYSTTLTDVFIVKTNSTGDTLWTRKYGGVSDESGSAIRQTTDGGYIVAGSTGSFGSGGWDVYLIKTDLNGDTLWTKTYGDMYENTGWSVQQTLDGGYIIGGTTLNPTPFNYDVWQIKINTTGDTLWTKKFGDNAGDEYAGYDGCVKQTSDGGYIICGLTDAGNTAAYVVKTDSMGNVIAGISNLLIDYEAVMNIFPNPSAAIVNIHFKNELPVQSILILFDVTGQRLKEIGLKSKSITIDVSDFADGIYFLQLISKNKILVSKKVIVQH